ncbi:MAG: D-amino acid aminotransferase [Rhodocyclaceae bacterium]|nr:D-amino acid aminotransferase [Rhodocyclaceae bacterium]
MTVYLNGEYLPIGEARVPVLDRGFLLGDGVYEVIPVYARRPFRLPQHLARLQNSCDGIRLANPHDTGGWTALIGDLIGRQDFADQNLYLQVTRGVAKRDHAFPQGAAPTVFMMANPLVTPSPAQFEAGVAAVSTTDNRWQRCDIKSIALLANVLLRQLAVDEGAAESILFRDGHLTEGAASNIFAVKNGTLLAPPRNHRMLPGITYDAVIELARGHGIPLEVREISEAEVRQADELWLTSSTKEILPITRLDGRPVGSGTAGPLARRLLALYQTLKDAP